MQIRGAWIEFILALLVVSGVWLLGIWLAWSHFLVFTLVVYSAGILIVSLAIIAAALFAWPQRLRVHAPLVDDLPEVRVSSASSRVRTDRFVLEGRYVQGVLELTVIAAQQALAA